jgi:hypothetical protein
MNTTNALSLLIKICSFVLVPTLLNSQPEKLDEFSLGYVTKENYKELDWEDFRREENSVIKRGVIDGFLSVTETSPGSFRIYLYETLEAMEHDRPRRSIAISSEIFREGLSLKTGEKNKTVFHKKWVRIYGVIESHGRIADVPLASIIKCDSVEWRNAKGEMVRVLE